MKLLTINPSFKIFKKLQYLTVNLRAFKSINKYDDSVFILADENRYYFDMYNVEKSGFGVFLGSIVGFRFMKAIFKGYNPFTSMRSIYRTSLIFLLMKMG